jgi:hypothetical protein
MADLLDLDAQAAVLIAVHVHRWVVRITCGPSTLGPRSFLLVGLF